MHWLTLMMLLAIFVVIKQLLTEKSIVSGKQGWLETAIGQTEKNLTPLEERFIHIISRRKKCLSANPFCWRVVTVSGKRGSTKTVRIRLHCTWRMVKILTFCPFQSISKHFMIDTALHTNEKFLLQRCMHILVSNIIIAFTANKSV